MMYEYCWKKIDDGHSFFPSVSVFFILGLETPVTLNIIMTVTLSSLIGYFMFCY